jgi:hypothetical protein
MDVVRRQAVAKIGLGHVDSGSFSKSCLPLQSDTSYARVFAIKFLVHSMSQGHSSLRRWFFHNDSMVHFHKRRNDMVAITWIFVLSRCLHPPSSLSL